MCIHGRRLIEAFGYEANTAKSASACRVDQHISYLNQPVRFDVLDRVVMTPSKQRVDGMIPNALLVENRNTTVLDVCPSSEHLAQIAA